MVKSNRVHTGYEPRPWQEYLHSRMKRFNVLVCHRRFGKTVFSVNDTLDRGLANKAKDPNYAYIAPTFGAAKRIAWDMFKDVTKNIPGATCNESELRIDIQRGDDRVRLFLLSADKPDSIRGVRLDGCIIDEFATCDPTIWSQVVRPALSDRLGWATFIGTPKGMNHFYDIYKFAKSHEEEWFHCLLPASKTGVIELAELESARQMMSEEEYQQEYECSFTAALVGAYYGKEMALAKTTGRITRVPYDAACDVDTFWDLGIGDSTAIWFAQRVNKEFHLIDYEEHSGVGLDFYAKLIKDKPYVYGTHWLPHDAAARELGTGKSRHEMLGTLGLRTRIAARHRVDDGIQAVRSILGQCWFDEARCERGLDALTMYERRFDNKNKIYEAKPLHNWASHGADAFRILGMSSRTFGSKRNLDLPREAESSYNIFGGNRYG